MTNMMLRELTSSDMEWMHSVGQRQVIAAGVEVLPADQVADTMYLILEGSLALVIPDTEREISLLSPGDLIGTSFLLNAYTMPFTVRAKEKTLVLAIAKSQIFDHLEQELDFSARFYRALALLFHQRQKAIADALPRAFVAQSMFGKGILLVFSCLNDSDICWISNRGRVEKLTRGQFCLREGMPLEAVYIMLRGSLSIFVSEGEGQKAVTSGAVAAPPIKQVAQVLPGEILGMTQFLGFGPNPYSMQASEDSVVLTIPLPLLIRKLQQDISFASRFYRALAGLTMERTYQILIQLRYEQRADDLNEDGELDLGLLEQMSVARAKFNWLLQYLNVKV
jgi:CRP-like cAMP-binding protein